jgi:hypothetical protein
MSSIQCSEGAACRVSTIFPLKPCIPYVTPLVVRVGLILTNGLRSGGGWTDHQTPDRIEQRSSRSGAVSAFKFKHWRER